MQSIPACCFHNREVASGSLGSVEFSAFHVTDSHASTALHLSYQKPPFITVGFYLKQPLFLIGELLVSSGMIKLGIDPNPFLRRHQNGDWGDLCAEDESSNNAALSVGEEILSQYPVTLANGEAEIVVIMTEGDRSQTVVFLLNEPADD